MNEVKAGMVPGLDAYPEEFLKTGVVMLNW